MVPGRVTSYERSTDPQKSGAVNDPNSLIWTVPMSSVNPWDGIVPNAPQAYWKVVDGAVVEMIPAEKTAVDAPAVAAAAAQAAYDAEVTGNDWCTATLDELNTRINAVRDSLNADIADTTNVATAREAMTAMNTTYAAGFRKLARCLKARLR